MQPAAPSSVPPAAHNARRQKRRASACDPVHGLVEERLLQTTVRAPRGKRKTGEGEPQEETALLVEHRDEEKEEAAEERLVTWNGLSLDLTTLELHADYSRFMSTPNGVRDTLRVELCASPGKELRKAIKR